MGRFDGNKTILMERTLDRYDCRYRDNRRGWQPVHCINEVAHSHGDRNPSASVNLDYGYYNCHSCDLKGDAYALLLELEGMTADKVNETLSVDTKEEDTWLV